MIWYAAGVGAVVAASVLLLAGLCAAAGRGDQDQPAPDPDRTAAESVLFQIPPPEETDPS